METRRIPGTVRVGIRVRAPAGDAWCALADPARLALWFGDLDGPWGGAERIEFGDGDFFELTTTEVADHASIAFAWRFLGVGPASVVRWTISALPDGTEIEVTDTDAQRSAAAADELAAGWTDFFDRLARHLETGERTRYEWRADIDGGIELPGSFAPLRPDVLRRWLPVATDGFAPRWFFVVDEDGPRRFRVDDWRTRDGELTFSVEIPGAVKDTACRVSFERCGPRSRLEFAHTGWRALGLPDRESRTLRARFAATWTECLRQLGLLGARRA